MRRLHKYDAAVFLRLSPYLIDWLTRFSPKKGHSRKLDFEINAKGEKLFRPEALKAFDRYLTEPWPAKDDERPPVPAGIELEIKRESGFRCVICEHANGECSHIDPVHNSKNNHPHNLIYLCPNCHDLYDKKKVIREREIRSIKKDILDVQVSIWRVHSGLLNTVLSLIRKLELIKKKIKSSKRAAYNALRDEVHQTIKAKVTSASSKENPALAKKLKSACAADDDGSSLIAERAAFLVDHDAADCPLCKGTGSHNDWECPVCRGLGTVDAKAVDEIDLAPYEQGKCPLCQGSGTHNNWECPVCRGVGTVDAKAIEEIDLARYKQEKCPLCRGSGTHNDGECPVCRGVGTVDAEAIEEIDLARYKHGKR